MKGQSWTWNVSLLLTMLVFCVTLAVDADFPARPIPTRFTKFPNSGSQFVGGPFRVSIRPRSTNGVLQQPRPISSNVRSKPYTIGGAGIVNVMQLFMSNDINAPEPPPHQQFAKMARYLVSQSLWTSVSTISSQHPMTGSPFVSIFSLSDGPTGNSTGIPYFYMTPIDHSAINLQANPNASLVVTLAQGNYCNSHHYDPEDPRCAIATLTGQIVKIPIGSVEEKFAKLALFSKHPVMKTWPSGHHWFFAKLDVKNILVRDYFGGAEDVDVKEYFATTP